MNWNSGAGVNINSPLTNGPTVGGPSGAGTISITGIGMLEQAVGAPITNNTTTGVVNLTMTGAGFLVFADAVNNSGIFNAVAGQSIQWETGAGYTQSGVGTGSFNAGSISSTNGTFSTSPTSPIITSGTGNLSITANNTGGITNAISLFGAMTLNSTGNFIATATSGSIQVESTITSTIPGPTPTAPIFMLQTMDIDGTWRSDCPDRRCQLRHRLAGDFGGDSNRLFGRPWQYHKLWWSSKHFSSATLFDSNGWYKCYLIGY